MKNQFPLDHKHISSERLSTLFDEVWARIPSIDREKILGVSPHISDYSEDGHYPSDTLAWSFRNEFTGIVLVEIDRAKVSKHDDDDIRGAIAHELVHIYLGHCFDTKLDPMEEYRSLFDQDASSDLMETMWSILDSWGFEDPLMRRVRIEEVKMYLDTKEGEE